MNKTELPKWLDKYPLVRDRDSEGLELQAAHLEFNGNMPRHEAEAKAHKDYILGHRAAGAAHHLSGMKQALAVNDHETAKKHNMMYSRHLKAMGHDPVGPVPKEIQEHIKNNPSKAKFLPHSSDVFNFGDK